ncbi:unnamed protein product [Amaranthus hypochondriacus]
MSTPFSALSLSSSSPLFIHTITITGTRTRHTLFNCRFIFFNKPLSSSNKNGVSLQVKAVQDKSKESSSPEDITKKYGLEAGLWKILSTKQDQDLIDEKGTPLKQKTKGEQAKDLLAKYGGAYLATSITLSLISFTLCYALINAGVDVSALLQKVGIATNETGEKVGTFALAYAAHKAASPIRFPPTVALTPVVASWIGKKVDKDN